MVAWGQLDSPRAGQRLGAAYMSDHGELQDEEEHATPLGIRCAAAALLLGSVALGRMQGARGAVQHGAQHPAAAQHGPPLTPQASG